MNIHGLKQKLKEEKNKKRPRQYLIRIWESKLKRLRRDKQKRKKK